MPTFDLKNKKLKIVSFLAIHLAVSVVCGVALHSAIGMEMWINFMLGQLFLWVSLSTLSASVYLFFLKKNIALLVGVIVFKWPILMYLVFKMTKNFEFNPQWLALGFMPVLISALVWSKTQKD